jgi:hypothetical protein
VSGQTAGQRHWWADPARHAYRAADAERPEDGCASCGYLAEMHPNKAPAAGQAEVSAELILDGDFTQAATLRRPCPAPAPLVLNGGPYVGCQREDGHDGPHEVRITWGERS